MARHAEGWTLVWRRGVAGVRFTHEGERHEISTRSRDSVEAPRIAAKIYADFVSGKLRKAAGGALVHPATPLEDLIGDWIDAIAPELGRRTASTYEVYGGHWVAHFDTIGSLTSAGIGDYQRARLQKVVKSTVVKERSALRRFATWLVERGMLAELPVFPPLPRKALGTSAPGRRRSATLITEAEAEAIIAALPVLSERTHGGHHFPVRARFRFAYETGLRPTTLELLRWRDITPFGLHIRPEVDKNRWERTVPLSAAARAALAEVNGGEPEGFIFGGGHDYRTAWRKAAVAALGAERGARVSPYDLKHARVTAWLDDGAPVLGVSFLTGTRHALDRYAHASRRAAEGIVKPAASSEFRGHSGDAAAGDLCEGGDLNPHGNNPASTSS